MKTVMRVTIEEINPETKEVVETLVSEEKDGLYGGVCLMGNLESESGKAQIFIHHLTGADLCSLIAGSAELKKFAKIVATVDNLGLFRKGDDNGAN